jgi:D-erythronate 2-dehydrogenase
MQVLVTGGSGFLGQALIKLLLAQESLNLDGVKATVSSVISFDVGAGRYQHERLSYVTGDIADPKVMSVLVSKETGLVIHLAAVVSGTAEANFDLGMSVNLDGTRALLEACRASGQQPAFLFSSSIAVFGGALPEVVSDALTPTPQGSYGIQKYIGEQLVQDYSRKGFVHGRSVRVPTVVVRAGTPNGAASGFASNIIREPLAGLPAVLPVSAQTRMWVASPRSVIQMLIHALSIPSTEWGFARSLNLPGLTVSMHEELEALRVVGGEAAFKLVSAKPDPAIERLVKTWPAQFETARANELGFKTDANFVDIVRHHLEDR